MDEGGLITGTTDTMNASAVPGHDAITNCTYPVPSAEEMFMLHMSTGWSKGLLITVTVVCILTCVLFLEVAITISRSMEYGSRRGNTLFIVGLVPVFSVTSLTGLYIPKAALIGHWASTIYLSVALYNFLMLIFNYFGGPDEMVAKLATMTVSLAQAPLACCCPCCCVKIRLTSTNLHRLRGAVLQAALVSPLAYFVTAILWADGLYNPSQLNPKSAYLYLTVITLISTLVAMYALTIINIAADASLAEMYGTFRLKFSMIKFFMIVPSLQGLVVSIVSESVVFTCEGILSSRIRANMIQSVLIIFEMLLVLLFNHCNRLLHRYYRPLRQANQPNSLSIPQTEHRFAEIRAQASPLMDPQGNAPSFPVDQLTTAPVNTIELAMNENNHEETEVDADGSPSQTRVPTATESVV